MRERILNAKQIIEVIVALLKTIAFNSYVIKNLHT